jgi:hypothetical protein
MFNNGVKMGNWDSFDCQVQVEEYYNFILLPEFIAEGSEDIMDQAVLSLEALKSGVQAGSYRMESLIEAAVDMDEFWDESYSMEQVYNKVQLRRVGC